MMRLYLTLTVLMFLGTSDVGAQTGGQDRPNAQSMTGVVKALSASSLTVERNGTDMKFGLDSSTRIFARGRAGGRDLVWRTPPPKIRITDFVKVGDPVTVKYRPSGSTVTAVEVRVEQK